MTQIPGGTLKDAVVAYLEAPGIKAASELDAKLGELPSEVADTIRTLVEIVESMKASGQTDKAIINRLEKLVGGAINKPTQKIIQGDYVKGNKRMRDDKSVKIGRDAINSQVGYTLTNCENIIKQQPAGDKKILLEELQQEVDELLKQLPPENTDAAPHVAENFEMLVKQATSPQPNKRWYSVSAEGLLEASKWVKDFSGNILGTIGQLGKLIWPDYTPPSID